MRNRALAVILLLVMGVFACFPVSMADESGT